MIWNKADSGTGCDTWNTDHKITLIQGVFRLDLILSKNLIIVLFKLILIQWYNFCGVRHFSNGDFPSDKMPYRGPLGKNPFGKYLKS